MNESLIVLRMNSPFENVFQFLSNILDLLINSLGKMEGMIKK